LIIWSLLVEVAVVDIVVGEEGQVDLEQALDLQLLQEHRIQLQLVLVVLVVYILQQ
jgi:hypothetical protein